MNPNFGAELKRPDNRKIFPQLSQTFLAFCITGQIRVTTFIMHGEERETICIYHHHIMQEKVR